MQIMSKRCGLTLPLEITEIKGVDRPIPLVKLSQWIKFFMSRNLWYYVNGLHEPDEERCCRQWSLFAERYKCICPGHPVFSKSEERLKRTAALLIHGDEGRSRKKTAIMIISAHSVLGLGSRPGASDTIPDGQELNFIGHTWSTRWLLSVIPRFLYDEKRAANFQIMIQELVDDMNRLFSEGFLSLSGQRHYICILNIMGDWPFLKKAFGWNRTFENAAKHARAKAALKGICHICLADQPGFPWEDFESAEPRWRSTQNLQAAYVNTPALLQLPHDAADPAHFAGQDLFHAWHLGYGKIFIASVTALLSDVFPGTSINAKFEAMHEHLFTFCAERREQPYLRKLSRETIGWLATTEYPNGTWSKGSTTLCLTRWVLQCFGDFRAQITDGSLLMLSWLATLESHRFFSKLYRQRLWLTQAKTLEISKHGFEFLRLNGRLAQRAFAEGKALYLYMPTFIASMKFFSR